MMRFSVFSHMISWYAERTPDAPALRYDDRGIQTVSFSELERAVEARAQELRKGGKTCLGVLADGSYDCVLTIFAAVRAGMQLVLLDENTPEETLQILLPYTDVDMLWGDADLCDSLAPCLGTGVTDGKDKILFFTSGTTERAKAVVLTQQSLCASAYNGGAMLPLSPNDVLLCLLPLGHVFGFVCGLLWGLSCGACVALGRGARHYMDDCAYFRPTAVSVVPLLLGFLLKQKLFNKELKLVLVGAGDCPQSLLAAAAAAGLRVSFGYGLTETSSGVAISVRGDPHAMEICPDDTITLAPDGEILITAPTCMMQGYYKRPADTDAVLRDGVLHTGDLGRFDENGCLHITGRKKDILVLGDGTKLYLPECEQELSALLDNPELALKLSGGRICLVLFGEERDDEAIWQAIAPYQRAHARGQQIGAIARRDMPLPRTATGKLKRWEL